MNAKLLCTGNALPSGAVVRRLPKFIAAIVAAALVFSAFGREAQAGSRFPAGLAAGVGAAAIIGMAAAAAMAQQQQNRQKGQQASKTAKQKPGSGTSVASTGEGKPTGKSTGKKSAGKPAPQPTEVVASPGPAAVAPPTRAPASPDVADVSFARTGAPAAGPAPAEASPSVPKTSSAGAARAPLPVSLVTDIGE